MRTPSELTVLLLVLSAFSTAQTQASKPLDVAPEQVQRVEILYFPERILVRVALTPQRLEQLYRYKLEIRDVRESSQWIQLVQAIKDTSLMPSARSYDYRTAVLFFNSNGRRIASIYFANLGTGGTVNGESGTITTGMYRWTKSLLKGVE